MKSSNNHKTLNEVLIRYIDVSKHALQHQADSFNSMDSKSQTFISILAIFVAVIFGVLAIALPKFEGCTEVIIKIISSFLIISLVSNIICFFITIKSRSFCFGYSPKELRAVDKSSKSIDEIDKEISDSLEVAYNENIKSLETKTKWMKRSEYVLIINFIFSLIYCLIFIVVL